MSRHLNPLRADIRRIDSYLKSLKYFKPDDNNTLRTRPLILQLISDTKKCIQEMPDDGTIPTVKRKLAELRKALKKVDGAEKAERDKLKCLSR